MHAQQTKTMRNGYVEIFYVLQLLLFVFKKINKSSLIRFESRFVLQKVIEFNVVIFSIMFSVPLMFMCLVLNSCLSENSQCFFFLALIFHFFLL